MKPWHVPYLSSFLFLFSLPIPLCSPSIPTLSAFFFPSHSFHSSPLVFSFSLPRRWYSIVIKSLGLRVDGYRLKSQLCLLKAYELCPLIINLYLTSMGSSFLSVKRRKYCHWHLHLQVVVRTKWMNIYDMLRTVPDMQWTGYDMRHSLSPEFKDCDWEWSRACI